MPNVRSVVAAVVALLALACGNGTATTSTSGSTGGSTTAGSSGGSAGTSTGGCTPACTGKCTGAPNGCGGFCPAAACNGCCDASGTCKVGTQNDACGLSGATCTACPSNEVCASGTCKSSCTPNCSGKCKGASDGCGGTCATGSCNGCCDGNDNCQAGNTQTACGVNGDACATCSGGPCQSGICCTKTAQPACAQTSVSDGCGGTYAANCTTSGDICCGGASGSCCPSAQCCGSTCCAAGQECSAAGACCTPDCTNKCPYADDGCGHQCPVPATGNPGCTYNGAPGCCDSNGVCQPGNGSTACGSKGACQSCTPLGNSCNLSDNGDGGYRCCTPGAGCGYSCGGSKYVDDCGNVCPINCPYNGCCDLIGNCYVPGNTDTQCGYGGCNAQSCTACLGCSPNSCADPAAAAQGNYAAVCGICQNGTTQQITCGQCGLQTQVCQSGAWVNQGNCVNSCAANQCCNSNNFCVAGDSSTSCGSLGNACTDCLLWANGSDQGYGACQNEQCCLSKGAPVYSGTPASACCSGQTSCGLFGNCSCT